ncbi:hypothetical protein, variant 1 [Aphanomyces astaci]|nr:hypothetical protein, variant 1 [Aphanomyces astaci]ETV81129.1 hypothetical protein, variant 1 [Aphanomyces astaci]|eukprot:XP_009828988.1 hypothetical protein, variant 1 [Aphanomyces astaci]
MDEERPSLMHRQSMHSNEDMYARKQNAIEQNKVLQDQLVGKMRELSFLETEYVKTKREATEWKKKFDYVFRENELLSVETAKLDAAQKQIGFLHQEIQFKSEETEALRGLVTALEASNKKNRRRNMDALNTAITSANARSSSGSEITDGGRKSSDKESEVSALRSENSLLVKDLDRKDHELKLKDDEIKLLKERIQELESTLDTEQAMHFSRLKESQESIGKLETQLARHHIHDDVRVSNDSINNTPPSTPPPMPTQQFFRDDDDDSMDSKWKLHTDVLPTAAPYDRAVLDAFLDKVPFAHRDGASRILRVLLGTNERLSMETNMVLQNVSAELVAELKHTILPWLKAKHHVKVAYFHLTRHIVATDVKLVLEPREQEFISTSGPAECASHVFLGPAPYDNKLVLHTMRTLHADRARFVSSPDAEAVAAAAGEDTLEMESLPPTLFRRLSATPSFMGEADNTATSSRRGGGGGFLSNSFLGGSITGSIPAAGSDGATSSRGGGGLTKSFLGSIATAAKTVVMKNFEKKQTHPGTRCAVCSISPIVGDRFRCATCEGYDLCSNCYAFGAHGLENTDDMFGRVQELVLARCPRLAQEAELLELLRFEICRSNLRKFSFVANWLADIVQGRSTKDLRARAIEVPSIRREIRKQFVPLLMMV